MAARMLELECPGCDELLELDAGFAGGVCRCSSCGTLMTVPMDPGREKVERLLRPDRPGGKTRRPSRPGGAAVRPKPPHPGSPDRPDRPDRPGGSPSPASPDESEGGDSEVYTTETGRVVRVDHRRLIPTAGKKRVARYTTYAASIAVIACIVAACVFAAVVLVRNPPGAPTGPAVIEAFAYDPTTNPYTLDQANILGLPLRERTAVVVDASASSAAWLGGVKAALAAGLTGKGSASQVALIYATEEGPRLLVNGFETVRNLSPVEFAALHRRVAAGGRASLAAAVEQAVALNPSHLIVVTSQRLTDNEAEAIESALAAAAGLYADTVAVDRDIVVLDDLASKYQGRYVRLSSEQLERWRSEAERSVAEAH